MFRIFLLTLSFFSFSFASYEKIQIGTIDEYYKDKVSKEQLKNILKEIESHFETTLQKNIFDYSLSGKKINLVYVPQSMQEKRISKVSKKLKEKETKIKHLQAYFPKNKNMIENLRKAFQKENKILSEKVEKYNSFIKKVNKKKNIPKTEYEKIKNYEKNQKEKLSIELKILKQKQKKLKNKISSFNRKVNTYNILIQSYNNMNHQLETMLKGFKKVKGMTFGTKEIQIKSYVKDGKKYKEKSEKSSMNKIEIYGFDSLNELKAILAHEIGHLVGLPHINVKNALMNPIMQKNQIENLKLTKEDIESFHRYF